MLFILLSLICFISGYSQTYTNSWKAFTSSNNVSMGGAGFLISSAISLKTNPATYNLNRQFTTAVLKYPASITSQSAGFNIPLKHGVLTASIKHISYGIFKGYNEYGQFTKNYKSYDTWFGSSYSKKIKKAPIFIGSSINWHSSLFNRLVINELTFSTGGKLFFNNQDDAIGVTVHQFGIRLKNNKTVYILPTIVVSGSKKLSYLPVIIYTDLLLSNKMKKNEIFLGSRIKINKFRMKFLC